MSMPYSNELKPKISTGMLDSYTTLLFSFADVPNTSEDAKELPEEKYSEVLRRAGMLVVMFLYLYPSPIAFPSASSNLKTCLPLYDKIVNFVDENYCKTLSVLFFLGLCRPLQHLTFWEIFVVTLICYVTY